jgi:hypothetical protein
MSVTDRIQNTSKAGRVSLMVLVIISALIGAPMIAPSPVSERVSPVGQAEAVAPLVAVPIGIAAVGTASYAIGYYQGQQDGDIDVNSMTDTQLKNSMKARANANLIDQRTLINTEIQELNQSTYDRALSEANIEFISALNEGKTESVAVVEAKSAARNMISSEQKLALQQWNQTMLDLYIMNSDLLIMNDDSLSSNDLTTQSITGPTGKISYEVANSSQTSGEIAVITPEQNYNTFSLSQSLYDSNGDRITTDVQLINGSDHTIYTISADSTVRNPLQGSEGFRIDVYREEIIDGGYRIVSDGSTNNWRALGEYYRNTETRVMNNLGTAGSGYLSDVYNSYSAGSVATSDILTPYDYSRMSMDTNSAGSQSWANIQLATMGISGNLSTSMVAEMSDGSVIAGDLFTRAKPPNGSWEVGQTYNTSNYEYPFFVSTTATNSDGETVGKVVKLTGSFTISDAFGSDGESLTSVAPREYSASTTDNTQLEQRITELIAENADLESELNNQAASGSVSLDLGGNSQRWVLIAIALGGVLLFLADRSNNKPPRNNEESQRYNK